MAVELEKVGFEPVNGRYEALPPQRLVGLMPPDIGEEAYLQRLDEINDSWRIITDPQTGRSFEIAIVNQDKLGKDVVLFPSTEFSSITQNPGNAIELAAHGAANPDAARLYVAFFGNGGSDSLDREERKYLARTGRLTKGRIDGYYMPLDGVVAMARAITADGLVPNHVSGDESGGRLGLALMAALDKDSVDDAYLNGIPGISPRANYSKEMISEDVKSRAKRRGVEESAPGEITPDRVREAKKHLHKVYGGLGHAGLMTTTFLHAPSNVLFTYRRAFGGHDDLADLKAHAALQDTLAAMLRQEATVVMQFNRESRIHDIEDCIRFGGEVMSLIPDVNRSDKRKLEVLIGTGTLDSHTDIPEQRWRTERYALPSIIQLLLAKNGLKPDTVEPLYLPELVAEARAQAG